VTGVIADTGPLYSLAVPSDQYHSRARSDLARLANAGLGVTILYSTLVEGYSLLLRRAAPDQAFAWVHSLRATATFVSPKEEDFESSFHLVQRYHDQPIALADALVAVISQRLTLPVWTYDHHFDVMRIDRWR
jgi:predicted nucleic acid-binding protein